MDLADKVRTALIDTFDKAYIRLEDDRGITGFIVTTEFEGMPSMERQDAIEDALAEGPNALNRAERSRVYTIAGFTPEEFDSVGTRIRVHELKALAGGEIEVLLHGRLPDAEYVRGRLNTRKNIRTSDPTDVPGAAGILVAFRAGRDDKGSRLTRDEVARILAEDPYIDIVIGSSS